ncbi:Bug family tripartite tricarboxylate transporter substrate binding protein [Pseudorhodoplanes sinuspersici]|nr:tripartite tricarboxylate transporter substrate binding protein [Pseudorhodoplanes sinuspersici]RKE68245.1 tripartite-type tricarboxylate transporter receptor subunit TctC [Pseudorhodoplanes sinuspersici]
MKKAVTLCVLALMLAATTVQAQTFPDRPVRFIVPNPAGGSNDGAARTLGQALAEIWPHGVVVENRAGGGGNIGTQAAATSAADGYTFLLTSPGPLTINPSLYKKLPFAPTKDFSPIALVATVPIVLLVNPKVPATNVRELIALAKEKNGQMNFASSGVGSTHHLAAELFKKMTNVRLSHIPYRGAAPAMNDLIAGHVPILFDNLPTVIPHVQSGTVRALAVASPQRLPSLPDVPTFAEAGMPDFEASSWFGLFAPAGTPTDVVAKVIADVKKTLARPDVQKKFEGMGSPVGDLTGDDFAKFLKKETEKWADVIRISGATISE